jgi:hypothetical protein
MVAAKSNIAHAADRRQRKLLLVGGGLDRFGLCDPEWDALPCAGIARQQPVTTGGQGTSSRSHRGLGHLSRPSQKLAYPGADATVRQGKARPLRVILDRNGYPRHVRFAPDSDRIADISGRPLRADIVAKVFFG